MSLDLWARVLVVFIFHNGGWSDIAPLFIPVLAIWCTFALAYCISFESRRPPLFFGVPSWRAHW